jgi:hypothetical protein
MQTVNGRAVQRVAVEGRWQTARRQERHQSAVAEARPACRRRSPGVRGRCRSAGGAQVYRLEEWIWELLGEGPNYS